MKRLLLLFLLFISLSVFSQEYKDTVFTVREHTCACKYNLDEKDDNSIFDRNSKDAHYPGGEEQWKKFIKQNMYKGFKGKHEVTVRFQVDKNGDLSGYTLLGTAPAQKYEEAVRMLRLSGKWFPSVQKGFCVKTTLSRVFEL